MSTMKREPAAPSLPMMRVLIVEAPPDYTIDGTPVGVLNVGGEYELPRHIAEVLLALQVAVLPIAPGLPLQPVAPRRIH